MADNHESQLAKYQANVYPAMLADLAGQLGVFPETVGRLGLGWAPIVKFKKGYNHQGWWAIPERDHTAKPIGLSLRNQSGYKCAYPGSKRGLVYELNPDHHRGQDEYVHGAHNWLRVGEAGIDCPVCGKPDGCMVSSEDPHDPKAVTCIRPWTTDLKPKGPLKFGTLFILKEEGNISSASPLPPSSDPVVVVEGMTDTAVAMDLGFVAVGRPSNLACMGMLADLVRGREVIVVGENDQINPHTGKSPGEEGMIAAYQMLKQVCPKISMVMPPANAKDLRQWCSSTVVRKDDFLKHAEENKRDVDEQLVLPDGKSLTLARAFMNDNHRMAGRYILRYYGKQWMRYRGTRYEEVDEEAEIRGPIYGWADDKQIVNVNQKGEQTITPLECHKGTVNNILDAMYKDCPVVDRSAPCWINGATGPDPDDLIVFKNGILWVSKYLDGADEREYLIDPTPDLFTTFALPYSFDPTAEYPLWLRTIDELISDDEDKIDLLQEWVGYNLTPDISKHKMMMFRGQPRSGKSTVLEVLQAVVGSDLCASTRFSELVGSFGLQSLVGAQVAIMGDARLPRRTDNMQALEILLNIVGGDAMNINRKYLPPLRNHTLRCKFTISTNELPELPDHSGALEARLNIIDFNNSFLGKEDYDRRANLVKEAPGISVWALEGLRRLRKNDRFTVPSASRESLHEFRAATSPTAAFVGECCEEGVELEVDKDALYDAWSEWSGVRGMRVISKSRFYERLKANASHASSHHYTDDNGIKRNVFRGLRLDPRAERKLLGRPN